MKTLYLLLTIILILTSCSFDDTNYVTINGKVERAINGEGIADQSVIVMTRKAHGSGLFAYTEVLDSIEVITDANGNFSTVLINDVDAFITIVYQGDEDYSGSVVFENYPINEPVIIKVDKFIKFKIFVKNTDPLDENDFIKIDLFTGITQARRTNIENFGIENTHHPANPIYNTGAWEETSWTGINVNSIVYYSVPESADQIKIYWEKRKQGVETKGFTNNIPYDIEKVNSYSFEY